MDKKQLWGGIGFSILVFFLMVAFFTEAQPLVMYDGDDWNGLSKQRNIAFPKWHDHNPIKVLPESLMPLAGSLAAYFVSPFLGDFVASVTLVSAALVSGFIAVYVYLFLRVMEGQFGLSRWSSCLLAVIFLAFHFLVFRGGDSSDLYLFAAPNLTCYYNYTIPALVNMSLVLFFLWRGISGNHPIEGQRGKDVLLVFVVFLALCSNVLHSIILMAYVMTELLWNLRGWRRQRFFLGIFAGWLLTILFEATGGRAGQMGQSILDIPLGTTFLSLLHVLFQNNKGIFIALAFAVIFIGSSLFIYLRRRERDEMDERYRVHQQKFLFCALIWTAYVVLVCARAGGGYVDWPGVTIGLFFYLFLLMMYGAAYVFRRKPGALAVLPILTLIMFCRAINPGQGLIHSTMGNVPPAICAQISRDLIRQVQAAEEQGLREMELHVPKGNDEDNWPHPNYMGPAVSRLLYGQGVIPYPIRIKVVPDGEMNVRYGLDR